jgi:HK97 family phage prohead protease
MLYKNVSDSSIGGVIKDVDVKTGTVTGYFAIFGNVDSDGDMIMPGAFKRTLNNNYKRIKHLAFHDSTKILSGTRKGNLTVKEDAKGLYFESKISDTSYGRDIITLYDDGAIDEHSIGYEVKDEKKTDKYNQLNELKLWEGTTTPWGANEQALLEGMKGVVDAEQLQKKHATLMKAIRNGTFENEDLFDVIELHLKQLEQHIIDLQSTRPAANALDPLLKHAHTLDTEGILAFIELQKQLTA